MSFFYLSPVRGDIPIHSLENIVKKRIEFLTSFLKNDLLEYNEYVIEGSLYDNVGHFVLCIILRLCAERQYTEFFMKAELELFKQRLKSCTAYDLRIFAKKLLRTIRKCDDLSSYLLPLTILCQHLLIKHQTQHICDNHSSTCREFSLRLNFKYCLSLVSKRKVELDKGKAKVPCGIWKDFMIMLFRDNLKKNFQTNLEPLRNDPRIIELVGKVVKEKLTHIPSSNIHILLSKDVDRVSEKFPPCMLNLHLSLRSKHRLSHDQRFIYSLFLKDIGLPIEEAISFWSSEYRLIPSGKHSCTHNWERDERKYMYGIRHMYGLEGARKNYTSVSCARIQNASAEGGCPFKSFDANILFSLLKTQDKNILEKVIELKQKSQYCSACICYLNSNLSSNIDCNDIFYNFTPVKYYSIQNK